MGLASMNQPAANADFDVAIIGGGAAGLMCALTAGHAGLSVIVIEHANRVGKKILMSGGGRCNFTNTGTSPANFISANPHFCKSALARYRPADFIALVEKHGIGYHEKELGQLFCNDSSKQIVRMLTDECDAAGVKIHTSTSVQSVSQCAEGFSLSSSIGTLTCRNLTIATGGLSIPAMGATGFGYELARQFGHTVLPTRAGLVPLTLSGRYSEQFSELSGVALPVRASVGRNEFSNALLITHRGLSGPAILQISSYWQAGISAPLQISLLPDGAAHALAAAQATCGHLSVTDWLANVLPKRFAVRFGEVYGDAIGAHTKLAECSKAMLANLVKHLDAWPILPSGDEGYRTAEVTLGGVDTREISSSSMQSKRVPGLYFIGEVLDVTGHLGGYNFQMAWASGVAAGRAFASEGELGNA
jgi:predicted Rossmann fold flavoprotein